MIDFSLIGKREKFESEVCDPDKHWTSWCIHYFGSLKCSRTCYFAVNKDKDRMWKEYESILSENGRKYRRS
ncbi:MAG: hypothetical protein KKF67_02855 [Nanoarchaeota archaeon]|nr:hypothetical protein [Nanoarchaeota archaeon]